jgi:hypothetical protein
LTSGDISRSILEGSWHALETTSVEHIASLPIAAFAATGARQAIDADGFRHLLVPAGSAVRGWTEIASPLRDCVRSLTFDTHTGTFVDVRCSDATLYDLFDELILDVLNEATGSGDAGEKVESLLERWRSMFRAISSAGFGRKQRFGLFAELVVLEMCVDAMGSAAVQAWTGPSKHAHDFELPAACIEVKAVGVASRSVTIHSFAQLEEDRSLPLFLIVYTLAESEAGRTIGEILSSIESKVGKGSLATLLAKVGYTTSALDDRLSVVGSFAVEVDDRMPALSRRTVTEVPRSSVTRVEYDLDLDQVASLKDHRSTSSIVSKATK